MRPCRIKTAAAAQAPLPQASVSPAPYSYTRKRMRRRDSISANPTLTVGGNICEFCNARPTWLTGAVSMSSTSITACGLPMETAAKRTHAPSSRSASYWSCGWSKPNTGIISGANCGTPMAIRKECSVSTSTASVPDGPSSENRPPRANPARRTQAAMQRVPLPHCCEGEPSAVQIPKDATASALRGALTPRTMSQPTPVWRLLKARHSSGEGSCARRKSSTTKSLPAPCILLKCSVDEFSMIRLLISAHPGYPGLKLTS